MIVVGLTGSIGAGKSLASVMLRRMGIPVLCSDEVVHDLLAPGGKAVAAVAARFPDALDQKEKKINRAVLGKIVFSDAKAREDLETIIHPLVNAEQRTFLRLVRPLSSLAVLDIPLLFETGAEKRCDATLCVVAPRFIQSRRVLARPGMTQDRLTAIRRAQMPDAEKARRADFIIRTGLGKARTFRALQQAIAKILEKSSREKSS